MPGRGHHVGSDDSRRSTRVDPHIGGVDGKRPPRRTARLPTARSPTSGLDVGGRSSEAEDGGARVDRPTLLGRPLGARHGHSSRCNLRARRRRPTVAADRLGRPHDQRARCHRRRSLRLWPRRSGRTRSDVARDRSAAVRCSAVGRRRRRGVRPSGPASRGRRGSSGGHLPPRGCGGATRARDPDRRILDRPTHTVDRWTAARAPTGLSGRRVERASTFGPNGIGSSPRNWSGMSSAGACNKCSASSGSRSVDRLVAFGRSQP